MLVPNTTIWDARIQNVDALLTASAEGRREVYYLATVCQVALEPPLVSVSPNPNYPICKTIEGAGRFGISFLASDQGHIIKRCIALDHAEPDKIAALRLDHEDTPSGTPLLLDCLQSLECQVERAFDSGDHRTFIGRVTLRKVGTGRQNPSPHLFGGRKPKLKRLAKSLLCGSGIYGLMDVAKGKLHRLPNLGSGTRRHCEVSRTCVSGRW